MGQAWVALVCAGAGAEGRQRDGFIVVFWVARVINSRAGERLLGIAKSQAANPPPNPLGRHARRQDLPSAPPQSHACRHLPPPQQRKTFLLFNPGLVGHLQCQLSSTLIYALLCLIPSLMDADQFQGPSMPLPWPAGSRFGACKALSTPALALPLATDPGRDTTWDLPGSAV